MSTVLTTWEDLAALGWSKAAIFKRANARREGTMNGEEDLHLNDRITEFYGYVLYGLLASHTVMTILFKLAVLQHDHWGSILHPVGGAYKDHQEHYIVDL